MVASLIIGIGALIICNLILLPYDAYWMYQFWQNRDAAIIQKRKPALVIISHSAGLVYNFLAQTGYLLFVETNSEQTIEEVTNQFAILLDFAFAPFFWVYITYIIIRYWSIFYMIQYNASRLNSKWQSILDPRSCDNNWYCRNKETWGNWKYVQKWLLPITICLAAMVMLVQILFLYDVFSSITTGWIRGVIYTTFFLFLPTVTHFYFVSRIPKHNDDIGIRKEMITSTYFSLFVLIGMVAMTALLVYLRGQKVKNPQIVVYLFGILYRSLFSLSASRNTRWPLKTFKDIIESRHDSVKMIELAHQKTYHELDQGHKTGPSLAEQVLLSISNTLMREKESLNNGNESLQSVMKQETLFDAFMLHLFNEYCAECLLSIIEFNQFKERMFEEVMDDFDEEPMQFYKSLTPSYIVYEGSDDYIEIARKLYKKYIDEGSEWEINIDFGTRNSMKYLFKENRIKALSLKELYEVFDPCIDIMITMLMPSFSRFKKGKKYQMIQKYNGGNGSYEWNKM